MKHPDATIAPAHIDPVDAETLLKVMTHQLEHYRRLHGCINRKRQAIRSADIDAITALCQMENALIQRLGDLEKQRLECVGRVTERAAPRAAQPLSASEIAARLDGPIGAALAQLATRLRDAVTDVRRESSVVAAAADALNRHVSGIMQTVTGALTGTRVYESRGRLAVAAQPDHCIDIKS
jgi:hypothetical protein